MSRRQSARRESFRLVSETCPDVDRAMEEATSKIKVKTEELREALIDQIQKTMEAEERCEMLEAKIASLDRENADLKEELTQAKAYQP